MSEYRQLFHSILNHLNNISLTAGLCKEELNDEPLQKGRLCESFTKIENHVSEAAKQINELRVFCKPGE